MKNCLFKPFARLAFAPLCKGYFFRLLHNLFQMVPYVYYGVVIAYPRAAFKVKREAAVFHIDRADGCDHIVRNKEL